MAKIMKNSSDNSTIMELENTINFNDIKYICYQPQRRVECSILPCPNCIREKKKKVKGIIREILLLCNVIKVRLQKER